MPPGVKIGLVILQGAVCGASWPTAIALLWEVIGRGVAESRRGVALALAFGVGPFLAVLGSLGSQLCLTGRLGPFTGAAWSSPATSPSSTASPRR